LIVVSFPLLTGTVSSSGVCAPVENPKTLSEKTNRKRYLTLYVIALYPPAFIFPG
jgi:hypothetical protein